MAATPSGALEASLLRRWQAGDEAAAGEIVRLHAPTLCGVVRGRLAGRFARRLDPEDVVQSALGAFFHGLRDGRFHVQRGGDLWRLLAGITAHKLQKQVRRHLAGRRSVRAESDADAPEPATPADPPAQAAAFADALDAALAALPAHHRPVVLLRLEGHDLPSIAETVGCSTRTAKRVLEATRQVLSDYGLEDDR